MGKKMFIFTSNDTSKYSNYLINRPGRIHYLKKYETVEENVVRDIATDNLKDKTKVESLVKKDTLLKLNPFLF